MFVYGLGGGVCFIYNITHRRGPSDYKSGVLGVQTKLESLCIPFQAFDCYIMRVHKTRDEHCVIKFAKKIIHGAHKKHV